MIKLMKKMFCTHAHGVELIGKRGEYFRKAPDRFTREFWVGSQGTVYYWRPLKNGDGKLKQSKIHWKHCNENNGYDQYSRRKTCVNFKTAKTNYDINLSRLMCMTFFQEVWHDDFEADHIDGDCQHDEISNLRPLTKSQNTRANIIHNGNGSGLAIHMEWIVVDPSGNYHWLDEPHVFATKHGIHRGNFGTMINGASYANTPDGYAYPRNIVNGWQLYCTMTPKGATYNTALPWTRPPNGQTRTDMVAMINDCVKAMKIQEDYLTAMETAWLKQTIKVMKKQAKQSKRNKKLNAAQPVNVVNIV